MLISKNMPPEEWATLGRTLASLWVVDRQGCDLLQFASSADHAIATSALESHHRACARAIDETLGAMQGYHDEAFGVRAYPECGGVPERLQEFAIDGGIALSGLRHMRDLCLAKADEEEQELRESVA